MHDYKKLNVWQDSINLVKEVYLITKKFPSEEKFGLVSQMNRAAVSVPSNIAEGAGRNSIYWRKQDLRSFVYHSIENKNFVSTIDWEGNRKAESASIIVDTHYSIHIT